MRLKMIAHRKHNVEIYYVYNKLFRNNFKFIMLGLHYIELYRTWLLYSIF